MCPEFFCGPTCQISNVDCLVINNTFSSLTPIPKLNEGLFNFFGPTNTSCPNECCNPDNEYCFRTVDNTGNNIEQDQEIMLVFGGIAQNEVIIEDQNISDNCTVPRKIN
jgi:hypothetical protein